MDKLRVLCISLGCDKNKVDSEKILDFFIKKNNMIATDDINNCDIVILNTCAFIQDAKNESINYIKYLNKLKKQGIIKEIWVYGCLVKENYLLNNLNINYLKCCDKINLFDDYLYDLNNYTNRINDILSYCATLKIADGCNKNCSYCIIPKLRGKYKSEKIENLIKEAKCLSKGITKELNIVAQEVLSYGLDLYKNRSISLLLDELEKINNIKWIRLLYCYPEEINMDVVKLFLNHHKLLHYIDIPIQHSSNKILKIMNRPTTRENIIKNINLLREYIPDICIRTSIITGFPGENDDDFNDLIDFINEIKFDKLGCFTYSREILSDSYSLPNQVDKSIMLKRKRIILNTQKKIVNKKNKNKIGKIYDCIIDGYDTNNNCYVTRNYENAKDIDDIIKVYTNKELITGSFIKVKIINYDNYDLIGDFYED